MGRKQQKFLTFLVFSTLVCYEKKCECGLKAVEVWAVPFFEIILFSNAIETNKRGIVLKTLT